MIRTQKSYDFKVISLQIGPSLGSNLSTSPYILPMIPSTLPTPRPPNPLSRPPNVIRKSQHVIRKNRKVMHHQPNLTNGPTFAHRNQRIFVKKWSATPLNVILSLLKPYDYLGLEPMWLLPIIKWWTSAQNLVKIDKSEQSVKK